MKRAETTKEVNSLIGKNGFFSEMKDQNTFKMKYSNDIDFRKNYNLILKENVKQGYRLKIQVYFNGNEFLVLNLHLRFLKYFVDASDISDVITCKRVFFFTGKRKRFSIVGSFCNENSI